MNDETTCLILSKCFHFATNGSDPLGHGYGTSGGFLRWLAQRWWQWIFCFLCVAGFSLSWIIGRVLTHLIGARLKWEVGSWRCRVFRLFMNSFFHVGGTLGEEVGVS